MTNTKYTNTTTTGTHRTRSRRAGAPSRPRGRKTMGRRRIPLPSRQRGPSGHRDDEDRRPRPAARQRRRRKEAGCRRLPRRRGGMSSTSSVSSARLRRSRVGLHYSSCSYHHGSPVIVVGVRTPLLPTELRFGDVPDLMCGSRVRGGGVTDTYLHGRLDMARYSAQSVDLRHHVVMLLPERCGRSHREGGVFRSAIGQYPVGRLFP